MRCESFVKLSIYGCILCATLIGALIRQCSEDESVISALRNRDPVLGVVISRALVADLPPAIIDASNSTIFCAPDFTGYSDINESPVASIATDSYALARFLDMHTCDHPEDVAAIVDLLTDVGVIPLSEPGAHSLLVHMTHDLPSVDIPMEINISPEAAPSASTDPVDNILGDIGSITVAGQLVRVNVYRDIALDQLIVTVNGIRSTWMSVTRSGGMISALTTDQQLTSTQDLQTVLKRPELSAMKAALEGAGVFGDFANDARVTVFAPSNSALAAQPGYSTATQIADSIQLNVIRGAVLFSACLQDGATLHLTNGKSVGVTVSSAGSIVRRAAVTDLTLAGYSVPTTDIPIPNGVVHIIDGVFVSPDTSTNPTDNASSSSSESR